MKCILTAAVFLFTNGIFASSEKPTFDSTTPATNGPKMTGNTSFFKTIKLVRDITY